MDFRAKLSQPSPKGTPAKGVCAQINLHVEDSRIPLPKKAGPQLNFAAALATSVSPPPKVSHTGSASSFAKAVKLNLSSPLDDAREVGAVSSSQKASTVAAFPDLASLIACAPSLNDILPTENTSKKHTHVLIQKKGKVSHTSPTKDDAAKELRDEDAIRAVGGSEACSSRSIGTDVSSTETRAATNDDLENAVTDRKATCTTSSAPAIADSTSSRGFSKLQSLFRRRLDPSFNQINPCYVDVREKESDETTGSECKDAAEKPKDKKEKEGPKHQPPSFPHVYITNLGGATAVFRNTAPYVTSLSPIHDFLKARNIRVIVTALSSRAEDAGVTESPQSAPRAEPVPGSNDVPLSTPPLAPFNLGFNGSKESWEEYLYSNQQAQFHGSAVHSTPSMGPPSYEATSTTGKGSPTESTASKRSFTYTGGDFYPQHYQQRRAGSPTVTEPNTPAPVLASRPPLAPSLPSSPPHAPLPEANVPHLETSWIIGSKPTRLATTVASSASVTPYVLPAPPPLPSLPTTIGGGGLLTATNTPALVPRGVWGKQMTPNSLAPASMSASLSRDDEAHPNVSTPCATTPSSTSVTKSSLPRPPHASSWAAKLALTPSSAHNPPSRTNDARSTEIKPSKEDNVAAHDLLPSLDELVGVKKPLSSEITAVPDDDNSLHASNDNEAKPPTCEEIALLAEKCPSIRVFLPTCPDYEHRVDAATCGNDRAFIHFKPYPVYLRIKIPPMSAAGVTTAPTLTEADEEELSQLLKVIRCHEEKLSAALVLARKNIDKEKAKDKNPWLKSSTRRDAATSEPHSHVRVVDIPFYYIHVPIEDNQNTRLATFMQKLVVLMGVFTCPISLSDIALPSSSSSLVSPKQTAVEVQRLLLDNQTRLRHTLSDNGGQSGTEDAKVGHPLSVLVHCLQGVSRSASIVLAFMMAMGIDNVSGTNSVVRLCYGSHVGKVTYNEALDSLCSARQVVNPNPFFRAQLVKMDYLSLW